MEENRRNNLNQKIHFWGLLFLQVPHVCTNIVFLFNYLPIIRVLGILLLLYSSIINLNSEKLIINKIALIFFIIIGGVVSYFTTKDIIIFELLLMVAASIGFKFNEVVKNDFRSKIIIFILIVSSYLLGYTSTNFTIVRNGELRNAFGFYHPNTFGMYVMIIFLEYIYLMKPKNIRLILSSVLLATFVNFSSNARSAVYGIVSATILVILRGYVKKSIQNKIIAFILGNIYVILFIISIFVTILYINKNDLALYINELMTRRLSLQAEYMSRYDIKLFGNMIDFTKTLDNGYLKCLLNYGILVTILYAWVNYSVIKKAIKNNNFIIAIYIVILQVYTMSESSMLYIYFNIFLLYAFTKEGKIKETEELKHA